MDVVAVHIQCEYLQRIRIRLHGRVPIPHIAGQFSTGRGLGITMFRLTETRG